MTIPQAIMDEAEGWATVCLDTDHKGAKRYLAFIIQSAERRGAERVEKAVLAEVEKCEGPHSHGLVHGSAIRAAIRNTKD